MLRKGTKSSERVELRRTRRRRKPPPILSSLRNTGLSRCHFHLTALTIISRPKKILTWSGLNYHVPVPGGTRRLLHDVQGYVGPGLTALMGASGAGKTTCLDVLAQRKNIGVISGDILLGGRPLGSDFARGTAYGLLHSFILMRS
jgi:ABC-type multidrug transport system fused ATPase/permease subunit